jgi:hypothetical protein
MQERHSSDSAFRGRMRSYAPVGTKPARLNYPVPAIGHPVPKAASTSRPNVDGFSVPKQPTPHFSSKPVHTSAPTSVTFPGASPTAYGASRMNHKPGPAHTVAVPRQHKSVVLQRQSVKKSAQAIHRATRKRRFSPVFVFVLSASIFVVGVGATAYAFWIVHHSAGQVAGAKTDKADGSKNSPFESPPTVEDYKSHTTQSDLPRYVRIPGLRINARAQQVGYEPSSGLETPVNIYDIGWYGQSGRPNDVKTMVFSVRTKGKTADSPYTGLDKLKPGNFIEVEQGDGNKLFYKVVSSSPVEPAKFNMAVASMSADSKKQGLNIVSYSPTGPDASAYEPTLIVYTVRM